jgi:hypothetical protein
LRRRGRWADSRDVFRKRSRHDSHGVHGQCGTDAGGTRVEISTNDPEGYALVVQPQAGWFSSLAVFGAGGQVMLGSEGGTIVERGPVAGLTSLELTYRFVLPPGVTPGLYPWPLHLLVQPLQSI